MARRGSSSSSSTEAFSVEVEGLAKLRRELRRMEDDAADLKRAHQLASEVVANAAAARAPRRTGKLASSIKGSRATGRSRVTGGGARVPYAGPIHWGWPAHGIEAQPFISEAAQATESLWLRSFEAALDDAVGRVRGAA